MNYCEDVDSLFKQFLEIMTVIDQIAFQCD